MEIKLLENNNTEKKYKLNKDDLIKINDGEEVFWAIVTKKLRNCVLAKIDTKLLFEKKYNYGDTIKCKDRYIYDHIRLSN